LRSRDGALDCFLIVAIGNSPNPLIPNSTPDITVTRHGTIVTDETTGRTTKKFVYAGGDIVTGAATVILAMGAGKVAAKSIIADLLQHLPQTLAQAQAIEGMTPAAATLLLAIIRRGTLRKAG